MWELLFFINSMMTTLFEFSSLVPGSLTNFKINFFFYNFLVVGCLFTTSCDTLCVCAFHCGWMAQNFPIFSAQKLMLRTFFMSHTRHVIHDDDYDDHGWVDVDGQPTTINLTFSTSIIIFRLFSERWQWQTAKKKLDNFIQVVWKVGIRIIVFVFIIAILTKLDYMKSQTKNFERSECQNSLLHGRLNDYFIWMTKKSHDLRLNPS